ncbi:hypothetical protein BC567DRAFT_225270 [Phyllosticta citribraziliensis]
MNASPTWSMPNVENQSLAVAATNGVNQQRAAPSCWWWWWQRRSIAFHFESTQPTKPNPEIRFNPSR